MNHAQEGIEEVAKNPGIIRTWLEGLLPDLLNFAFQILIALLVYVIGGRIIKWITKLVRRSMDRAGTDEGVKQFMIPVIKYSLYVVLIFIIMGLFEMCIRDRMYPQCSCQADRCLPDMYRAKSAASLPCLRR